MIKLLLISSTVTDLLNIDACTLYAKLVKPVDVRIMLLLRQAQPAVQPSRRRMTIETMAPGPVTVNVTGTNF